QNDLHSDDPGSLYVGLQAQPFLNEVAVQVDPSRGAGPVDYAVELANPYPFPIDLAGVSSDPNSAWSIEIRDERQKILHAISLAKAGSIPARGYYVVTLGNLLGAECGTAGHHTDAGMIFPPAGYVMLKRPVKLAETSTKFDGYVIVDSFGWHNPLYGGVPANV